MCKIGITNFYEGGNLMKSIAILDNNYNIKQRIKAIMTPLDINVIEVSSSEKLFGEIRKIEIKPCLIILELNLENESGFSAMEKLKNKNLDIPIIILTSENKRSSFIKGIQAGAIDYILKPFKDEEFKERIVKHITFKPKEVDHVNKEFSFNFQRYLQSELKKAEKGKYSVSILMSTFYRPVEVFNEVIEKEYLSINDLIYNQLRELFWDTDIFVKYGSQSFIGIFPFSDENTTKTITEKINSSFKELQNKANDLSKYDTINVCVTSPLDGNDKDVLFKKLVEKMEKEIINKKQEVSDSNIENLKSAE